MIEVRGTAQGPIQQIADWLEKLNLGNTRSGLPRTILMSQCSAI